MAKRMDTVAVEMGLTNVSNRAENNFSSFCSHSPISEKTFNHDLFH